MSQSTVLYTTIRFSRKTYDSIDEVQKDLDIAKASLERSKATISKLCTMTEPQKYCGDESPMFWLDQQYNEALENIEDESVEIYKLEKLIDEWVSCHDEKTGLAVPVLKPTEKIDEHGQQIYESNLSKEDLDKFSFGWKSFLDGDFIKTIYEPDGPELK